MMDKATQQKKSGSQLLVQKWQRSSKRASK